MSSTVEPVAPREGSPKKSRGNYIREVKEELKKVTWTTRSELILSTKLVVGSTFVFGIGIYAVDLLIKTVLNGVAGMVHFIFG